MIGCNRSSPDRELHHLINLVPPDEVPEGEALELDDEGVGESPDGHLFGGLPMLLTGRAVPRGQIKRSDFDRKLRGSDHKFKHTCITKLKGSDQKASLCQKTWGIRFKNKTYITKLKG